jgi:hypothetical protein
LAIPIPGRCLMLTAEWTTRAGKLRVRHGADRGSSLALVACPDCLPWLTGPEFGRTASPGRCRGTQARAYCGTRSGGSARSRSKTRRGTPGPRRRRSYPGPTHPQARPRSCRAKHIVQTPGVRALALDRVGLGFAARVMHVLEPTADLAIVQIEPQIAVAAVPDDGVQGLGIRITDDLGRTAVQGRLGPGPTGRLPLCLRRQAEAPQAFVEGRQEALLRVLSTNLFDGSVRILEVAGRGPRTGPSNSGSMPRRGTTISTPKPSSLRT